MRLQVLVVVILGTCAVICPFAVHAAKLSGLSRCGPIAMQVCATACGCPISGEQIDEYIEGDADGCTLLELQRVGNLLGLHSVAVQYPNELPPDGAAPAVLPTVNGEGRQHFVALVGCCNGRALIVDLPDRPLWLPENELRKTYNWHGEALHFAADESSIATLRDVIDNKGLVRHETRFVKASVILACFAFAVTVMTYWRGRSRNTETLRQPHCNCDEVGGG
jgi:ABC-type bacteriocin/lantibiotic exporter with double-glycine peptidase domain